MSVVEEIKERLDIVDVISAYVPLRKAGRTYKGLCPFHQEKTPSFVVFPESGNWHCFGACGTGGDVFSFVIKQENLDFREALELLAQKAGVSLEAPDAARSPQSQLLDKLREINQAAAVYYHSQLLAAPEAQPARDYLGRRGLDQATMEAFLLGFAHDRWDALLTHLRERGYDTPDILAAGLIIEKEHETGRITHYDRFRGRVVVPIRDVQGRVIGFGARALEADQQPKYLNTPQTPLFEKSSVLFGLDRSRQTIRMRDQAIIVEGYMDVLAAHQHGETNVVASMGTALTEQQLRQLKRYTNTFVLALDADTAGQAATLRGIAQAREALDREWVPTVSAKGLVRHEARLAAQLLIMTLPEDMDPDDVIRSDPAEWKALVSGAKPVVDYFFDLVQEEEDLSSAQGKSQAVERLTPLIQEVADEVQRAHYVQRLARLVQTDERTVERLVLQRRAATPAEPPPLWEELEDGSAAVVQAAPGSEIRGQRASRRLQARASPATHCLALLALHPRLLPELQAELTSLGAGPLDEDDFDKVEERAICTALLTGTLREGGVWPEANPALGAALSELTEYGQRWPELTNSQLLKDIIDSVLRLRISNLKARSRQLPYLAREALAEGQPEEARAFMVLANDLREHLHMLEQALNARTHAGRRQATPYL